MDIGASSYRRFLDGDDEAFVEIIKHYKDGLILYLDSFTHNLDTAEDLMEDTFVKIITQKPNYRPGASFKTWLFAIARNLARDWLRKHAKRKTIPIDEAVSDLIAADDLERQYLCTEEKIQLYRALRRIHSDYAQVLYLVFFEGFNNSQVAVVMKKSNVNENSESLSPTYTYIVNDATGEEIKLGDNPMTAAQLISFFVNGGKEMLDGPVNQDVHIAKRDVQQKATIHSIVVNTASVTFRYTYGADAVQEPGEFGDVKVVLTDGTVINGLGPYGVPGDNGEFISTYATTTIIPKEDIDYVQVGETIVAITQITHQGSPMILAP